MTDQPNAASGAAPATPTGGNVARAGMSRWKKIAIVVAGLVLLGIVAALIAVRATAGPVDAADRFLKLNATEGPAAAWAAGSPAFQASGPVDAWESLARATGLTAYKSSSWTSREVANNTARLEGSISTQSGATLPATIELVYANGLWQVQTLRIPRPGFQGLSDASGPPVVSPPDQSAIATGNSAASGPSAPASGVGTNPAQAPGNTPGASSLIPAGGAPIPGAKVAGTCKQVLLEQTGIAFDSVSCPIPLAPTTGATTQCAVSKGTLRGTMTVTTGVVDAATQRVGFHCSVGSPT